MPNIITNIVNASPNVLAGLINEEQFVDFSKLIPIPLEAANITGDYTLTGLASLLTGKIPLKPSSWDLLGSLQMAFLTEALTKQGGIATLNKDELENFVTMLRNDRDGETSVTHPVYYPRDWIWKHWGTGENGGDFDLTDDELRFNTAWAAPLPVIDKLAAQFPDSKIVYSWADEDVGVNCGCRIYQYKRVDDMPIKDLVDFALTVTGRDRMDFRISPLTGAWEHC